MGCIRKRGNRLFLDFYDQFGVRQRESLPEGTSIKDARKELVARERKVENRTFLSEKKIPLFSEVAKEWLEYKKSNVRETTWEVMEGIVRNHFHDLDNLKITLLNTATVEKYIRARQTEGVHINTLRKVLVNLGQIMAYAVRHRLIDHNPVREAEKPRDQRENEKDIQVLNPEQIRAFLDAVTNQKYRTLFLMAIMTGARQGELLGLKWGDLDFEKRQVHIQRTFNKGRFFPTKTKGSKRKIDLSPTLLMELKKWKLACPKTDLDLIFPNNAGGPINKNNMVDRHFEPALLSAGIIRRNEETKQIVGPGVRFHDLRHTFASLMIEQGENIKYIQTQLGHSSPMVTLNVYAHLMKETNQEAVCKLENTIFETGHQPGTEGKKEVVQNG